MVESDTKTVLLDIAPREQWENAHGYCGEASLQAIGLYYGSWISQQLVRTINDGEFLLTDDGNDQNTITTLLFKYERWNFETEETPQYKNYCLWLKKQLMGHFPCIFTVYVTDLDEVAPSIEYDHIVPAIGIKYSTKTSDKYDSTDELYFFSLFENKVLHRKLCETDMIKTREKCDSDTLSGGSIPKDVGYGYAITGILDENHATFRVQLYINSWDEPNLSTGSEPIVMYGTVVVSNLIMSKHYALLRYNTYKNVPTSGNAADFLKSKYYARHDFMAQNGSTYTFKDPDGIPSNGSTYYRCVEI
ncbi:unnamed protein product [Didymodactylos carnosus]|nr:unnamed protein product [Didymodactylos carnosus]CAF3943090.1 unnamed protein product [Didymodactylos carnosus]